jgi:hypothetical protein
MKHKEFKMAYIGKIKLSNEWESVESLASAQGVSLTFGSNTYQLQGEGPSGVRLANASAKPTEDNDGERIANTQVALYTKDSGTLYARTESGKDEVWLKVSELS